MAEQHYDASDIQVLEGLEAVRKRPGMYIGATSSRGLHHLVWEIVDNAIDEALAGYCDDIEIIINKDGSVTVKDDGRGIPVGKHAKTGLSTVETVYTVLHAGGKFGGGGYKVSGGLHGVGASVVNALSKWVEVRVYQGGEVHYIRFENGGKTVKPLEVIDKCDVDRTGTTVTFMPDPTIFTETTEFEYALLKKRAQELAFLNKGLRIILCDDRDGTKDEFVYEGGISEYVNLLNSNKTPIHEQIVHVEGIEDDVVVEVAFQYNDGYNSSLYSFVNNITTPEGGTHEDGVKLALTRIINNYAKQNKMIKDGDDSLTGDDVREGITMIISVKVSEPQFEGQTKTKLGNTEVRKIANSIFSSSLDRFLMENPETAKTIINKGMLASRARLAATRAREASRNNKKGIELITGKLKDCMGKNYEKNELFIVEGDSALSSALPARDSNNQAILPIRGKILNVEKARLDRAYANEEIRSLIKALGTGIAEEFDISKLRYHKIIFMTDADVDGAHIRTLLMTLFYRFFKPLVEQGHIYVAQPPLYKITIGKQWQYLLNDNELNEYLKTIDPKTKYVLDRNKGLGEMDAHELKETTMDINTRTLRKMTIEDGIQSDKIFETLMGEEVEPRRQFIEENATYVKNLDV